MLLTHKFTDKVLQKMAELNLSEKQVLDVWRTGDTEKWSNRMGFNAIKKFIGYEIGVSYFNNKDGISIFTSVWKRKGRR